MSTLDENLIHTLKKEIADLQAKLDAKCKTIEVYDAVTNALPVFQKVAIAHAHIAATKGASSEELAALVSLEGQHKVKVKLESPKVHYKVAGHGMTKPEVLWPTCLLSTCSVCDGEVPVGSTYAEITWPNKDFPVKGTLNHFASCHEGCVKWWFHFHSP